MSVSIGPGCTFAQIHRHRAIELFEAVVIDGCRHGDAGVVHQNVDASGSHRVSSGHIASHHGAAEGLVAPGLVATA